MTFELYNEWVKVARWVWALGQKSLVRLKKTPATLPPSLPAFRAGPLSLFAMWRDKNAVPGLSHTWQKSRWPKISENSNKNHIRVSEKAAAFLIARRA